MKRGNRLLVFLLLQILMLSVAAKADEIDRYMEAQIINLHISGASLAVVRGGKIVKARGYGFADLQSSAVATPETVYEIGSMTKQFTAVAVMMLAEEGKLSLDDSLTKYFPAAPAWWNKITIRHLLTHTSGIRNHVAVPGYMDLFRTSITGKTFPAREDLLNEFYQLPKEFAPGETWAYDNTGFYLLGVIIEKIGGKSYWDFLNERIFKPLAMTHTRSTESSEIVPHRAAGYGWTGRTWENRPILAPFVAFSAGSILSTVEDLAKWDAALYTEKLLKKSSLEKMWTPARTNSGELAAFDYGFGWFIEKYRGHRNILHSGGTPGFSSVMHRFADDRMTIIILTNHADLVLDQMPLEIAGRYEPKLKYDAPRVDPNPEQTAKMQRIFSDLLEGKPDAGSFTEALNIHLRTATGKSLFEWYAAAGALKSLTFLEREPADGFSVLRYRVQLGESFYRFSFKIANGGKIAQIYCW